MRLLTGLIWKMRAQSSWHERAGNGPPDQLSLVSLAFSLSFNTVQYVWKGETGMCHGIITNSHIMLHSLPDSRLHGKIYSWFSGGLRSTSASDDWYWWFVLQESPKSAQVNPQTLLWAHSAKCMLYFTWWISIQHTKHCCSTIMFDPSNIYVCMVKGLSSHLMGNTYFHYLNGVTMAAATFCYMVRTNTASSVFDHVKLISQRFSARY